MEDAAAAVAFSVPIPTQEAINAASQCLLLDGRYYWTSKEVAATLSAYFEPFTRRGSKGRLKPGFTEADFEGYISQQMAEGMLQKMRD